MSKKVRLPTHRITIEIRHDVYEKLLKLVNEHGVAQKHVVEMGIEIVYGVYETAMKIVKELLEKHKVEIARKIAKQKIERMVGGRH